MHAEGGLVSASASESPQRSDWIARPHVATSCSVASVKRVGWLASLS